LGAGGRGREGKGRGGNGGRKEEQREILRHLCGFAFFLP